MRLIFEGPGSRWWFCGVEDLESAHVRDDGIVTIFCAHGSGAYERRLGMHLEEFRRLLESITKKSTLNAEVAGPFRVRDYGGE